eukprot:7783443-Heterocapsa_arctica.AAC.1
MGALRGSTSLAGPRRPSAPARCQPGTSTSAVVPFPLADSASREALVDRFMLGLVADHRLLSDLAELSNRTL